MTPSWPLLFIGTTLLIAYAAYLIDARRCHAAAERYNRDPVAAVERELGRALSEEEKRGARLTRRECR